MSKVALYKESQSISLSLYLILAALLLYCFSYPWPKDIRLVEIAIGGILVVALSRFYVSYLFVKSAQPFYQLFFLYTFSVGLFIGYFASDNDLTDIVRDLIPILYLFIGPAMASKLSYKERIFLINYLPVAICIIAISFTIRVWYGWLNSLEELGTRYIASDLYIAQSPTLIFAAVYLANHGIKHMFSKNRVKGMLLFVLFLPIFGVLLGSVLRGPSALVVLSITFFLGYSVFFGSTKSLINYVVIGVIGILIATYLGGNFMSFVALLVEKQNQVGSSGKIEEYYVMYHAIDTPLEMIFGRGLGGLWGSPTTGGHLISFTHSLINYSYLKFGLFGLIFSLVLTYNLFKDCIQLFFSNEGKYKILAMALGGVYVVNIFLEPGFKALSFGFIVLFHILVISEMRSRTTEPTDGT